MWCANMCIVFIINGLGLFLQCCNLCAYSICCAIIAHMLLIGAKTDGSYAPFWFLCAKSGKMSDSKLFRLFSFAPPLPFPFSPLVKLSLFYLFENLLTYSYITSS